MIRLDLPYPPMTNNLYVNVPGKGRRRSHGYKVWSRAAGNEWMAQRAQLTDRRIPGDVAVSMVVDRSRKGDLDNTLKAVLDFLVKADIIDDDRHVQSISVEKGDVAGVAILVRRAVEVMAQEVA